MAGPFALPGNTARDIAPIQLAGGETGTIPKTSSDRLRALEGAQEIVQTVGQLNQKRLENEATSGVAQDIKAVRDALQISKHPNLVNSFFSEEALQDPYVKEVYARFQEIQDATDQGRLPSEYGLERMEAIMSEAVSRRPQFADAIRKAANDTAGANISSKVFSNILSTSPIQDTQIKLQQEAARLGLPVDVYQGYLQQQFLIENENAVLRHRKEVGNYTANDMATQVRLGVTSVTREVQGAILADLQQGGTQDPETLKALARQQFTILRNEMLAGLPTSVDGSVINGHINTLDAEEERILEMIDDGSMVKLLQSNRQLFDELANEDVRQKSPDIAKLFAVMGKGQGAINVLSMWTKYKQNPVAFQGMYSLEQGGALTLAEMLLQNEHAANVVNGNATANTPQEKRLAGYQAALRMKYDTVEGEKALPPQTVLRLVDVISNAGEEYSTLSLADPQIATAVKGYKEVHSQVINHYNNDLAALQIKFNRLKAAGVVSNDLLVLRDGQIQLDNALRVSQIGAGNFGVGGTTDSAELNTFVRQANQTLRMGQQYKANGVFPDTVFKDSAFMLNTIKSDVTVEPQAPRNSQEQEVINVTINPDGSFSWN